MYSRGILGSCFWKMFLRPVRMMREEGEPSLVTTTKRMISARSSAMAGRSRRTCITVSSALC
jgi:hypothetical protein